MNQCALRRSRSASLVWGARLLAPLLLGAAQTAALAAESAGLALVLGAGSQIVLGSEETPLPEGARIELLVKGTKEDGRYPVQLRPGGLALPDVLLGEGKGLVRVRIAGLSSGWLTPRPDGAALELSATVQVELTNGAEAAIGEYPLLLTTEAATADDAEKVAGVSAEGERISYAGGALRLVAGSTVSLDSPVAAGEPLLVVLEGTLEGMPADLR